MVCYQIMIKDLNNVLTAGRLPYKDSIIIGDNSSGKSEILYQFIREKDVGDCYFIDAVNRYFDVHQIKQTLVDDVVFSYEISRHRLEANIFNLDDSFYYKGVPRSAEDLYILYSAKINQLMCSFFQVQFEIKQDQIGDWNAVMNHTEVNLSSGYQAVLRILLELSYVEETKGECTVIIDEIDEYLSALNCRNIFRFLRKHFEKFQFIVTTHSADLVADTENANLIVLHEDDFEVMDAGDFDSITQVYNIFSVIFKDKTEPIIKKKIVDEQLRILFNNRTSGIWGQSQQKKLEQLQKQEITKAQKVMLKRIEEW